MIGLLIPVLLALVAGLALGGSLAGWSEVRLRFWPAALTSLLVLLILFNPPLDRQAWAIHWGPWVFVGTHLVLCGVLFSNAVAQSNIATRVAFGLAALGVALNLVVIVANGGYMPQSAEAHRAVWGFDRAVEQGQPTQLKNTIVMTADTRVAFLGDVIAQPSWWPKANVVSVGDLALAAGLAALAFQVTTSRRRSIEPRMVEAR